MGVVGSLAPGFRHRAGSPRRLCCSHVRCPCARGLMIDGNFACCVNHQPTKPKPATYVRCHVGIAPLLSMSAGFWKPLTRLEGAGWLFGSSTDQSVQGLGRSIDRRRWWGVKPFTCRYHVAATFGVALDKLRLGARYCCTCSTPSSLLFTHHHGDA